MDSSHPPERLEALRPRLVEAAPALAPHAHQARPLEDAEVLRHRPERDAAEGTVDLPGAALAPAHEGEDLPAARRGKGEKRGVHRFILVLTKTKSTLRLVPARGTPIPGPPV